MTKKQNIFTKTFQSLGNRDYLFLWIGMICIMGGIQMQMIARGYLVYDITSRPILLGIVNGASAIPILILSLHGGAIADRLNRKRMIQVGQGVNVSIAVVVTILIITENITWIHLMLASMFQGALWAFMMPARQAIIPNIVGKDHLTNALALNAAGMSAMTLLSPAFAGFLYNAFPSKPDATGVYIVVTILGFAAIFFTSLVRYTQTESTQPKEKVTTDIKQGLTHILSNKMILVLLIIGIITTVLAMPFRFLLPVFVVDIYQKVPEALGLLVSLMGLGSLAGSMFIAGLEKWNRGMILLSGSFLSGIGLLLIAILPFYLAASFIMLILGLGDATRRTLNQPMILEVVEDRFRGRVMSMFMMTFGLMPLGTLPAALSIELFGGQITAAILGLAMILVASVVTVSREDIRRFQ